MKFAVCIWEPEVSTEWTESLKKNKVTAIEPGPTYLLDKDEAQLEVDAELIRNAGVTVYSCHAPFGKESNLSAEDEDERKGAIEELLITLERTVIAGAECLIVHPGAGRHEEKDKPKCFEQLYTSLDTVLPKAESNGIALALENMLPMGVGDTSTSIREVIDDFNSPFLGVCFDTGHAHLNEEGVMNAFAVLRDKIIAFHLQDNDGIADKHLQPPYGTIDWETFIPEYRSLEFEKPAAVETRPWNNDPLSYLMHEINALFREGLVKITFEGKQIRAMCSKCGRYLFKADGDVFCGCSR
jgi:sugar phosphate isomerase/epimerase